MPTLSTSSSNASESFAAALGFADSLGGAQAYAERSSGRDDQAFSQMMAGFMESTPAEITPTLDVNAEWRDSEAANTWLAVSDPYAGGNGDAAVSDASTLAGVEAIPTSDIRLTEKEVHEIADNLRKAGVDVETVKRVEEVAGHPGGASVTEVVRAVASEEPAKLTEGDLTRIEALATELDPTGELAKSVLADLRNGQTTQAWASLSHALNAMEPGSRLTLDRDAVLSLGKALRLSQGTLSALEKSFGGKSELTLSPEDIKKLMTPAQKEVTDKSAAREKLALALEDAMKPVVRDARKRLELEAQAGGRTSRRTEQSQALILDTVTRNGFERQQGTAAEQAEGTTQKKAAASAGEPVKESSGARTQDARSAEAKASGVGTAEGKPVEANAKAGSQGDQGEQKGRNDGERSAADKAGLAGRKDAAEAAEADKALSARQPKAANPWDALLERLDAGQGVTSHNLTQAAAATANAANAAKTARPQTPGPLAGQVLSQVEKGMLSAFNDGTKRLELQLNPLELGAVSVLLTSRNGEVSALLRPERPETASLLMQQLADLRADLEQQGLKVDRVDVQTQLKDEQGTTWQGMNQHNAAQEQQSRTHALERLRRLARTNGDNNARDWDGVPRMEAGGGGARLGSGVNLHLVA